MICNRNQILIPPPPSIRERVKELGIIKNQYYNPKNPDYIQEILDKNPELLFDSIITSAGYDSCIRFIDYINKENNDIVHYHKNYFKSMRPLELAQKVNFDFPCDYLESAQTPSYPSGHTAQAYYVAEVLSDIFPNLREKFFVVADKISQSRIDRGVHFPSDIEGGKLLAKELAKRKLKGKEIY